MKAGGGCGGWGSQAGRGVGLESDLEKLGRCLDGSGGSVDMGYNSYLYLSHQGYSELYYQLMTMGGKCLESEKVNGLPKGIQHVVLKPGVLTLFALFDLSEHLQSSWYRLVGTGPEPLTANP